MQQFDWTIKIALFTCLTLVPSPLTCLASETAAAKTPSSATDLLWQEPLTNQEFIWVPAGCFQMGQSPQEKQKLTDDAGELKYRDFYADETPQHKVCLDGFWLARQEISQRQWINLMATKPFFTDITDDHPATNISWLMAMDFITVLNGIADEIFRLPSEAEMEYSIRAGTSTPFHTGKTISTDQANYNGLYAYDSGERGTYLEKTTPSRSYPANQFGLFDLHGNVWEWCSDWYGKEYYQKSASTNPQGPVTGKKKVMRGGSWFTAPRSIRSANRRGIEPDVAMEDAGFRLVVNRPPPQKKEPVAKSGFDPDF